MNNIKLILAAALVGVSAAAMAADPASEAGRDQRMNEALENYRSSDAAAKNPSPGPFARAEESTKQGLHKAGAAIEHGARKATHAVGTGVEKTGEAIGRAGEKVKEAVTPAQ